MKQLHIAKGLDFPINAVTQKMAFLGRSSSGKTYGASKVAEEFLKNLIQTVILDPVGVWNGLRTSADGKGKGFSIPVFGGEHGDLPLLHTSGAMVADLIVDRGISAILDVSWMRPTERKQFITEFAEQLFHLKKKERTPMHLFMEEAQTFMPQNVDKGEKKMLDAMIDIVKLGRNYGIGISIITQRPQAVNKECLNQTEALFSFQINGPQERKAIEGWIIDKGLSKLDVGEDLSGLEVGTCILWSPQWLRILKKIKILPKITFDASKTPDLESIRQTRELAPVDIEKIKTDMQSVIDYRKENDPIELKKQIAELKKQIKFPVKQIVAAQPVVRDNGEIIQLKKQLDERNKIIRSQEIQILKFNSAVEKLAEQFTGLVKSAPVPVVIESKPQAESPHQFKPVPVHKAQRIESPVVKTKSEHSNVQPVGIVLGKCERTILSVLAQHGPTLTKIQIAILAQYVYSSGNYSNGLGKLNSNGLIVKNGDQISITPQGMAELGEYTPLPTGSELHEYWYKFLGKAPRTILKIAIEAYPNELTKDEVAIMADYEPTSGNYSNALGTLRTLALISKENTKIVRASDTLFH
jgi:hypothetical protein